MNKIRIVDLHSHNFCHLKSALLMPKLELMAKRAIYTHCSQHYVAHSHIGFCVPVCVRDAQSTKRTICVIVVIETDRCGKKMHKINHFYCDLLMVLFFAVFVWLRDQSPQSSYHVKPIQTECAKHSLYTILNIKHLHLLRISFFFSKSVRYDVDDDERTTIDSAYANVTDWTETSHIFTTQRHKTS